MDKYMINKVCHNEQSTLKGKSELGCLGRGFPGIQETHVPSLGQEDPLEKGTATHSNILAWRILWTEKPGGYSPLGHKESDTNELTNTFTF